MQPQGVTNDATRTLTQRDFARLVDWLLQNGNPVVKLRTLRELVDAPTASDIRKAKAELLAFPYVPKWLGLFDANSRGVHATPGDVGQHPC
jgi:hypothetical protein